MEIAIVLILIAMVVFLVVYNLNMHKKFQFVEQSQKRLEDLSVINELIKISGSLKTVDEKMQDMNKVLRERFNIPYSSIVIFDGKDFNVKATNFYQDKIQEISQVYQEEIFKQSINRKTTKYLAVENISESLPYTSAKKNGIKSAMFFPLFVDNIFVGFWLIESDKQDDFKQVDFKILNEIKDRILDLVKTMSFQLSIESLAAKDKFSKLQTREYLFSKGKNILDKCKISTVIMYRIQNLEDINNSCSRNCGNSCITEVTELIKEKLDKYNNEYIFVRYKGPSFVIAIPDVKEDEIQEKIEDLKNGTNNNFQEKLKTNEESKDKQTIMPKIAFAIGRYYQGTALENVTKELEQYLDDMNQGKIEFEEITYF